MPAGARRRGSELSIASDQRRQQFGYDGLGNWLTFKEATTGSWTLEQQREHNKANEIDDQDADTGDEDIPPNPIEATTGSDWVDPSYDEAGSMISGPKPGAETTEHCYQYDAWNRLRRVFTDADSDDTFDTGEAIHQESRYDGLNRRIIRIAGADSSWLRTDFYYNASWQILEEKVSATQTSFANAAAASTTAKYQYVWDQRYIDSPVLRDEDLDSDGDCTDDEPAGSERLCYANDANFNVTALVETDGSVAERTIYDAYGQPTLYDATWSATIAESASKANEIRFCGYVYDAVVGLYTVRYRVYDPALGRWVQRDPLLWHTPQYQYCGSKPLTKRDIYGLEEGPDNIPVQYVDPMTAYLRIVGRLTMAKFRLMALERWLRESPKETQSLVDRIAHGYDIYNLMRLGLEGDEDGLARITAENFGPMTEDEMRKWQDESVKWIIRHQNMLQALKNRQLAAAMELLRLRDVVPELEAKKNYIYAYITKPALDKTSSRMRSIFFGESSNVVAGTGVAAACPKDPGSALLVGGAVLVLGIAIEIDIATDDKIPLPRMRRKKKVYGCKCKRRGPVNENCPSIVTGFGPDRITACRMAKGLVPSQCYRRGATYGHCVPFVAN